AVEDDPSAGVVGERLVGARVGVEDGESPMRECYLRAVGGDGGVGRDVDALAIGAAVGDARGHFLQRVARHAIALVPGDDSSETAHGSFWRSSGPLNRG